MTKKVAHVPSAPRALGPYSPAVEANGFVFFSGQVGLDPEDGSRSPDVAGQARRVMDTIGAMLADLGLGYADIAKTTIFLADIADFAVVNKVYATYFDEAPPARSTVQAGALLGGFLVEIEVIAARP